MKKIRMVAMLLCMTLMVGLLWPACVKASSTYSVSFKNKTRGEYNITVKNATSSPVLYKKSIGQDKKVSTSCKKSGSSYILKASLCANTTYYVEAKGKKKITATSKKNQDVYSTSSKKRTSGIMWVPKDGSYQPGDLVAARAVQVVYLTKEEAMVYALNLDSNTYLKLLDTGIQLTAFIAILGLSGTTLGAVLQSVGKNKLISIAKIIVKEYGGIKLVPSMKSFVKKTVEEETNHYKTGLKIVTMYSSKVGYTNSYYSWNQKNSSVKGEEYCRGSFSTDVKLKGWY